MKHGTPVLAAVTFLLGALAAGGDGGTPLPPLRANYPKIVAIAPPGDGFFTKMLDFHGIPIKASSVVSDEALDAAYDRLALELAHLPVVTVNLVAAGAQLQIIGKDQVTSDLPELRALKGRPLPKYNGLTIGQRTRGMGGLETSCGEENLLKLDKDRYRGRDICLHEFAHCIRDHGIQAEIVARACPPSPARYASYLSAWALVNSGTPESGYGYWYPGLENDGGAGGGFEPAPTGTTWLGQPHHRGSWYYSCEENPGYCGALRTAATILTDDPIFGRFCFGGDWRRTTAGLEVIPKDGLRKRFHALIGGRLHLVSETDRFPAGRPIIVRETLSEIRFSLKSDNPAPHTAAVRLSGLPPGEYVVSAADGSGLTAEQSKTKIIAGQETLLGLPMAGSGSRTFLLKRQTRERVPS